MNAFKCTVKLTIHEVTSPGVRLANKNGIYVRVSLLEQQRRSKLVPGYFPLRFNDTLSFEKSFRYCRDELDVINNLTESPVLLELVQVNRRGVTHLGVEQVLAFYETSAKEFLYPGPGDPIKSTNHSGQRDVFLNRHESYPGTISPQIIFCASTVIRETQTPSMDILKQHEERHMNPPSRRKPPVNGVPTTAARPRSVLKPRRGGGGRPVTAPKVMFSEYPAMRRQQQQQQRAAPAMSSGGSYKRNKSSELRRGRVVAAAAATRRYDEPVAGEFANHTISSAIKADFDQPEVKFKLDELNASVKRTRVVKRIPRRRRTPSVTHERPFVVRKVDDSLILRKPELHDVLHDGLVLYRKSPHTSRSSSSRLRSHSLTYLNYQHEDDPTHRHHDQQVRASFDYSPHAYATYDRSASPIYRCGGRSRSGSSGASIRRRHARSLSPSLNRDLERENRRPSASSRSRSASRSSSNASPVRNEFLTHHQHHHTRSRSKSPSNCEVCDKFQERILSRSRLHHLDRLRTSNPSAVFDPTSRTIDAFNETHVLDDDGKLLSPSGRGRQNSDDVLDEAHQISDRLTNRINQNINSYPKKTSLGRYRDTLLKYDESYYRYYPWLNNYMGYLRDLENELEVLKLRSGRHY